MSEPRIVFIVGCGHSGSTLLDLLLSTHSQIASVGEAKMFRRRPDTNCTCGADRWQDCDFWKSVDARMTADGGPGLGHEDLESADPGRFSTYNQRLFSAVSLQSDCSYVIDSSKDYGRLFSFMQSGLPVQVIHLVRDPRGVVYSGIRKGRPIHSVRKRYVRTHVRVAHALRDTPHVEVHYEDVARDPAKEVGRVLAFLGLEAEPDQLLAWRRVERHNFGGNRMRHLDTETIQLDEQWRTELTPWQRFSIQTRALPTRVRSRVGTQLMRRLF